MKNTNNAQITKNQHFVPQTYLKSFCSEGTNELFYLNVQIATKHNKFMFKKTGTKNLCSKNLLYELKNAQGELLDPNRIENRLGKLENDFNKYKFFLLNNIQKGSRFGKVSLTEDEKEYWLQFMVSLIIRSPYYINSLSNIIAKLVKPLPEFPKDFPILALLFPVYNEYRGKTIFEQMLNIFKKINPQFSLLVNNTDVHFFTSDSPVILTMNDANFSDFYCFMPITPTVGMILTLPTEEYTSFNNSIRYLNENEAQSINFLVISRAQDCVICDQLTDKDKEYIKNNFSKAQKQEYIGKLIFLLKNRIKFPNPTLSF